MNDRLDVRIASPCPVDLDRMERVGSAWSCTRCKRLVHDLSRLREAEVARLFSNAEDPPCVRLYRRPDGGVMTADCPYGVRAMRRGLLLVIGVSLPALLAVSWLSTSFLGDRIRKVLSTPIRLLREYRDAVTIHDGLGSLDRPGRPEPPA